jgi:Pyridoxamine 5'-phosphate oxidase
VIDGGPGRASRDRCAGAKGVLYPSVIVPLSIGGALPQATSPGFRKLLEEPAFCQLATLMPDGSPHITQVWVEADGEHILINTNEGN